MALIEEQDAFYRLDKRFQRDSAKSGGKEKSCRARAERVEVFRYEHRRNIDD